MIYDEWYVIKLSEKQPEYMKRVILFFKYPENVLVIF